MVLGATFACRNPEASLRVGCIQPDRGNRALRESLMSKRRDLSAPGKQVRPDGSYLIPSLTVLFAVSAIALGVGVMRTLPDDADPKSQAASAPTSLPETTGSAAADESLCEKQAWPYVD